MASSVLISFKDIESSEKIRAEVEKRCEALGDEFPETTRFEVTLAPDGAGYTAHAHVTGNHTEVAAHAEAIKMGAAADKLMDNLAKQLRKVHDKKIFSRRRAAQRDASKRRSDS